MIRQSRATSSGLAACCRGDFGSSFSGRSQGREREVMELIGPRLWNTLFLASMTAIIAVPLALTLGITAALYRNSFYDRMVNATTLTTISFPEFFVAYILILLLATLWKVFPSLANVRESTDMIDRIYMTALPRPDTDTGDCRPHDADDPCGHHQPAGQPPISRWRG